MLPPRLGHNGHGYTEDRKAGSSRKEGEGFIVKRICRLVLVGRIFLSRGIKKEVISP